MTECFNLTDENKKALYSDFPKHQQEVTAVINALEFEINNDEDIKGDPKDLIAAIKLVWIKHLKKNSQEIRDGNYTQLRLLDTNDPFYTKDSYFIFLDSLLNGGDENDNNTGGFVAAMLCAAVVFLSCVCAGVGAKWLFKKKERQPIKVGKLIFSLLVTCGLTTFAGVKYTGEIGQFTADSYV